MENMNITINDLEEKLLQLFPKETAEDWDKTGLLVGDAKAQVTKIAVALDPTVPAIWAAKDADCNVLLTHHPAYLSGVEDFKPGTSVYEAGGSVVYEAIKNDVALINFHTALDVSEQGRAVLPGLLGLEQTHILCPLDGKNYQDSKFGFGMFNVVADGESLTLSDLAKKCSLTFDREPRVWGDSSSLLKKIGTTTGSTGSGTHINNLLDHCFKLGLDCIVCGEIKYHDALALSDSGMCIVDLGHDVSELPLVGVLIQSLIDCGVDQNDIICIEQSHNWI